MAKFKIIYQTQGNALLDGDNEFEALDNFYKLQMGNRTLHGNLNDHCTPILIEEVCENCFKKGIESKIIQVTPNFRRCERCVNNIW